MYRLKTFWIMFYEACQSQMGTTIPESFAKGMFDNPAKDPTCIKWIIIGGETWVYEYYVEIVQRSSGWRLKNVP